MKRMFNKKTVKDIDITHKTVLLRADYNVPIKNGHIIDNYRIKASLPTIEYLLSQNCRIVICSHLGRPKSSADKHLSLSPVAKELSHLLGKEVGFAENAAGTDIKSRISKMRPSQILVLENLRYYPEEEANDDKFAKKLAARADVFVQDGFGVVHRAHASTDAITRYLPAVAGLLAEREYREIVKAISHPERPLIALIGGAKIADKINLLKKFIDIADGVAIGGGMANTFLLAEGINIGRSVSDPNELPLAREIFAQVRDKAAKGDFTFYVPQDGVVAKRVSRSTKTRIVDWGSHAIADIENYPKIPPREASEVAKDELILDIGPFSGAFIAGMIQNSGSVIWNGTMGVTEVEALQSATGPFSHGTEIVMDAMMGKFGQKPKTVVGGGDTAGYLQRRQLVECFDFVSTGGGASLQLMSGQKLPGIEALEDKTQKPKTSTENAK